MVPRAVMHDYRDNFGNFSACFALEAHQPPEVPDQSGATDRFGNPLEETKGDMTWGGNVAVSREDPLALSAFH